MDEKILDDFEDLSTWTAITSGVAQLRISRDQGLQGSAMRLDFDFRGAGGFVVARKAFPLEIPEGYSFGFNVRGAAPANIFEFKLVDDTNQNVWRYRVEAFDFPEEWKPLHLRSSQIVFAWGPLGGGPPTRVAAIELVIAAGPGGKGTVWFEDLWFRDDTYRLTPVVRASSSLPGHEPQNALTTSESLRWQSEATDEPQWLLIDFQQEREYGGLVVQWEKGFQARQFDVQVSVDGKEWNTAYATNQGNADQSYIYLPQTISQYIRLNLYQSVEGRGFAIRTMVVKPFDFSRTINHFFQNIAREATAGLYPKYLLGRQTYWTPVGTGEADSQALMNEEGMVEVDKGAFSIEPFIFADRRLFTWADADLRQELINGHLPLPSSEWRTDRFTLKITAFATNANGHPVLYLGYRIVNTSKDRQSLRLFTVVRPFQVTPSWQNWRSFGGVTLIREMRLSEGALWVNGNKPVIPLTVPNGFGAAAFDSGGVTRHLPTGEVPAEAEVLDEFGYASGAFRFDLDLAAGSNGEVYLAIPFGEMEPEADHSMIHSLQSVSGGVQFEAAVRDWEAKLGAVKIQVPPQVQAMADTFKTAAGHILINRDRPALHPGPRRYNRSWIRDGAIMGAALIRAGYPTAIRDFIRWYAQFQSDDGNIPDCADREGTEWLPEFDAYGEFIYAVAEYYRFTGDKEFLSEMWPAVAKTLSYMEGLRSKRLTKEYQSGEKQACYGLLPESMSHEGYMAHPVHAYWDDFWAIRGLRDASLMAEVLGDAAEAERLASLQEAMSENVTASLRATMARHKIDFIPGSVEFGDFDPTATSVSVNLLDQLHLLPLKETHNTYDKYLAGFRERAGGKLNWNNYSAYEIRIVGALVKLGRRRDALDVMEFMLRDRRIPPWNQWPEISWRDPLGPSFIGDLPHTWISAEYMLSICTMFAYEREDDESLVIAAGVAEEWLSDGFEVGVKHLPTYYGNLSYSLRLEAKDTLRLKLEGVGLTLPQGGIVAMPPLPRPIRQVQINGRAVSDFQPESFTCTECPAEALVRF
jgi:hypothetical protein